MGFDKISVTLYDLLGYLLPGFVFLLVCSLAEASWFGSSLLALSRFKSNPIAASIVAYFLGQAGHAASTWIIANTKIRKSWLGGKETYQLGTKIDQRLQQVIQETYSLEMGGEELAKSDVFLLADSYIVASGGSSERDIFMAREGFFKTSALAFAILGLVFLIGIIGKTKVQFQPCSFVLLTWVQTATLGVLALFLAFLFLRRYVFFNCVKNNNALVTFLALRHKDSKPSQTKSSEQKT